MSTYNNALTDLPTAKRNRNWLKRIIYISLALIAAIVIARFFTKKSPEFWCEIAIKSSLKSPSSFSLSNSYRIKNTVHITFEAQNGFGAKTKGFSACEYSTMKDLKKSELTSVQINGKNLTKIQLIAAQVDILSKQIYLNYQSVAARLFGI